MATLVGSPDLEVAKPLATSQDKERARQAQALLSRQYKGRPAPEPTPLLDQLVYLILRHGLNPRQAKGAFNRLQSVFVDWNEVRVSSQSEIEEALVGVLAEKERIAKAAEVKAFLAEIFDRQHRVNMDYMVEWDPADVEQFLAQLSTLRGNDVGQVLSYLFADSRSPISQNVLRVLKRMGLFQHSVGPERARDELLDLVAEADLAKLNYLLYQHAAAVCTAKDYDCFHCVLSRLCHRGIERLKEGRKESSMAKTKSTKKAGTKKAAPKKAAKKKATKKAAPKKATAKKKPAKKAAKKATKKATKKK